MNGTLTGTDLITVMRGVAILIGLVGTVVLPWIGRMASTHLHNARILQWIAPGIAAGEVQLRTIGVTRESVVNGLAQTMVAWSKGITHKGISLADATRYVEDELTVLQGGVQAAIAAATAGSGTPVVIQTGASAPPALPLPSPSPAAPSLPVASSAVQMNNAPDAPIHLVDSGTGAVLGTVKPVEAPAGTPAS